MTHNRSQASRGGAWPQGGETMAKLLCITCGQPIPECEDYPGHIGQYKLRPDLTNVDEAADELTFIFDYLRAIGEVIPAAGEVSKETLHDLAHLVRDLAKEAERRTEWLYEAGKAPHAGE